MLLPVVIDCHLNLLTSKSDAVLIVMSPEGDGDGNDIENRRNNREDTQNEQRIFQDWFHVRPSLTPRLSGAGPRTLKCKQDAPSRVRSRPLVGHPFQLCLLHILKFQTAKAAVKIRTPRTRLPVKSQKW